MKHIIFTPLAFLALSPLAHSAAIVINLSDAVGGGLRVQMSGSADFSSVNGGGNSVGLLLAVTSTNFFIGNEQDSSNTANAIFLSNDESIDTSGVDDSFASYSLGIGSMGSIPAFGYFGATLVWDDQYVDNAVLNVDEVMTGVSVSNFIGLGPSVKTSAVTWDSGNESLTFIVSPVPEPSTNLLALTALVAGFSDETEAIESRGRA